jgi:hypothetical protein
VVFSARFGKTDSGFQEQYKKRLVAGVFQKLQLYLRLESQTGSTADRPPYTALNYLPAQVVRK